MMEWKLFRVKKDWKFVAKKALSCWVLYVLFILTLAQVFVPIAWDHGLIGFSNPYIYPALVAILTAGTWVARIVAQEGFDG